MDGGGCGGVSVSESGVGGVVTVVVGPVMKSIAMVVVLVGAAIIIEVCLV